MAPRAAGQQRRRALARPRERGVQLDAVEHAQAAAGAGADVDDAAAGAQPRHGGIDGARQLRPRRRAPRARPAPGRRRRRRPAPPCRSGRAPGASGCGSSVRSGWVHGRSDEVAGTDVADAVDGAHHRGVGAVEREGALRRRQHGEAPGRRRRAATPPSARPLHRRRARSPPATRPAAAAAPAAAGRRARAWPAPAPAWRRGRSAAAWRRRRGPASAPPC